MNMAVAEQQAEAAEHKAARYHTEVENEPLMKLDDVLAA